MSAQIIPRRKWLAPDFLTTGERALLADLVKHGNVGAVADATGRTRKSLQMRFQTIREKIGARDLAEAIEMAKGNLA